MGQDSPVMEKLARSLTEPERKRFLNQIHRSLRDDEAENRQVQRRETREEETILLLKKDIRQLSPFRYIILNFRRILTGKSVLQLFKEYQITQLKKTVRRKGHGIAVFETRSLKPQLAEQIFDLYIKTIPFQKLFKSLWDSGQEIGRLHELTFGLIEDELDSKVENCYDLLALENMVRIFREKGSKDAVMEEINKSIDAHVEEVSRERFNAVERKLTPLYRMKDLVLYPFPNLFQAFHGTIRQDDPGLRPLFRRTSAIAVLDMLEELYYAVYNTARAEASGQFNEDFVRRLFRLPVEKRDEEAGSENDHGENSEDIDEKALGQDSEVNLVETDAEKFINDVEDLQAVAKKFIKTVPLPELIRAFHEDPYYRLLVYAPRIDVENFYRNMKKLSLRSGADEVLEQVRMEALNQERSELFQGVKMLALHFYRSYSSIDYEKMGIQPFRYYQGLLILYNFLSIYYKGAIQRILQLLENLIPEQDNITRERLLKHASGAEDVLYKIRELDDSLSGEQEDGKSFQRLRFENKPEYGQKRIYQNVVQNVVLKKDKEAQELLLKGKEALQGILVLFKDFLQNRDIQVQTGLSKKYLIQGKVFSLYEVLSQNITRLELIAQIENQLDQIRDETGFDEVSL